MPNDSKHTIQTLEELGKILIQCRAIPSPEIDRIGSDLGNSHSGYSFKDFFVVEEPEMDDELNNPNAYKQEVIRNHPHINPDGYKLHAWVLLRNTRNEPNKPILTLYTYGRYNFGFIGEQIQAIPCYMIGESISHRLDSLWVCRNRSDPILEIGVTDDYDPGHMWPKKGAAIIKKGSDTLRIKPSVPVFDSYLEEDDKRTFDVPLEDATEIRNRFTKLLDTYNSSKQ